MSYIGQSPKAKRVRYTPQSADPSNPIEGDLHYSDGTARAEGLWVYTNGSFVLLALDNLVYTFVSKTNADSPYTVLSTDQVVLIDATSGAITINLPAAASNSGRVLYFRKIGTGANIVTIDGNASETIDGATTYLMHCPSESVEIISDGTNWQSISRVTSGYFGAITTTGSWSANTTYTANYWKKGSSLVGYIKLAITGTPTTATLTITLPNSWQGDTTKVLFDSANNSQINGTTIARDNNVPIVFYGGINFDSSTPTIIQPFTLDDAAGGVEIETITQAAPMTWANGDTLLVKFEIPITGFQE